MTLSSRGLFAIAELLVKLTAIIVTSLGHKKL